jgi:osmoprotectant transport system substrate-binding protein
VGRLGRQLGAFALAGTLVVAACTSRNDESTAADSAATSSAARADASGAPTDGQTADGKVIFAGFNFTESTILAHLYAEAAEAAGIASQVDESVGSREVMNPMLFDGEVAVVPEYVGAALVSMGGEATDDAEDAVEDLRQAMEEQDIGVLELADAENNNAVAVTLETATQFEMRTLTDLEPLAPDLTLGGPETCPARPLCIPGLEETYGISFGDFIALDPGVPTASALAQGLIDAAVVFTTDATISVFTLVLLDDDKGLYPAQNVVPVVRQDVLDAYPDLELALNRVTRELTTRDLRAMNYTVTITGERPEEAARTWLEDKGIL